MYRTIKRKTDSTAIAVTACVVTGLLLIGIFVVTPLVRSYTAHHHRIVLVNDKERVCSGGNSGCKYLVYTNTGTFRITDSLFIAHRLNSSDVYGQVKRCHKYDITYYGWRWGFTSSYPNIISMNDLGRDPSCSTS